MDKAVGWIGSLPRIAPRRLRFIPLAAGAVALVSGLSAGLVRIGIPLPEPALTLAEFHGALMISGFLGTLISLERAVASGRWWSYAAPAISALGAVALLAGEARIAMLCFLLAGAILVAATVRVLLNHPSLPTFLLSVAAASWCVGSLVALDGDPMSEVTGWWLTFLVLTIAAERLELSRLIDPPRMSQVLLGVFVLLLMAGAALGEYGRASTPLAGLGLVGCSVWLFRYDIARRTIRQRGSARFAAVCMIAGHFWLGAAGLLLLVVPPAHAVFSYDAVVHTIGIGFVLSMVFGHAPIILPAITGLRIAFTPFAYLSLALLYASVSLRVGADLLELVDLRAASGLLTVLALLGYAATILAASAARQTAS